MLSLYTLSLLVSGLLGFLYSFKDKISNICAMMSGRWNCASTLVTIYKQLGDHLIWRPIISDCDSGEEFIVQEDADSGLATLSQQIQPTLSCLLCIDLLIKHLTASKSPISSRSAVRIS
jgi:hypothetical protein